MAITNPGDRKTAFSWMAKRIYDVCFADVTLRSLLTDPLDKAKVFKFQHRQGYPGENFPASMFTLRMRSDELISYMRFGRLYISVYDKNADSTNAHIIADRIQCLLSDRGYEDVLGILRAARTYNVYSIEEMPTDNDEMQRVDLTFNVRYYDHKAHIEKLTRIVPNV